MMVTLTCTAGTHEGRHYELAVPIVLLGRLPDCSIVVDDPLASSHHAELKQENSGWRLTDLNSSNGTIVNGQEITSVPLTNGDVIQIGATQFQSADDGAVAVAHPVVDERALVEQMKERTDRI